MAPAAIRRDARYTYADYLSWSDDERWELIDGVAHGMTPALSRRHQKVSGEFFTQFNVHLKGKRCDVYAAPFDVRLPAPGETDQTTTTVVQLDLVVVCDRTKLDDCGCVGAPDLVVEIVSPESAARDLKEKFRLYERTGVLEYWVVHPEEKIVMVFLRGVDGRYGQPVTYSTGERVPVGVLPELEIDLSTVFAE